MYALILEVKIQKKIGDLRFESLNEMWNGDKRRQVMKKLNPSIDCANLHCIRHETNHEVDNIINLIKNKKSINEKPLPKKDYFI